MINSDPSDSHYHDLTVTARGTLIGGKGDRFFISGNFRSQSTNAAGWNTAAAQLLFTGGAVHIFDVNGKDLGPTEAGYENDFAWGTLTLAEGDQLVLENGSGTPEAGLYLQWLDLPGGIDQIAAIESNGVDVYYDPTQPGDSYLGGRTFTLLGGGLLMPDPNDPAAIRANLPTGGFATASGSAQAVPLPAQAIPALALLAIPGGYLARARRKRANSA